MTKYDLDLSTDNETVKFHAEFGFDFNRYSVLIKGNGNKVLYHLDGLDKVESMLDWLNSQKVISQELGWFQGNNENKLKSLAWIDDVNLAIVDNYKLFGGEADYIVVADKDLEGAVNRYVYKIKNHEY